MIAKLTGILDSVENGRIVLDVRGVGYLILVSPRTQGVIGEAGGNVSLLTEMIVREDSMTLYGFCDRAEREWFRLLTTVQGVGAKVALAILGIATPDELPVLIASQDKKGISRADGVGPKLAMRIVTELKDKVGDFTFGAGAQQDGFSAAPLATATTPENLLAQDAVSALVNLGFDRSNAFSCVSAVIAREGADISLDDMIKLGLKELSVMS